MIHFILREIHISVVYLGMICKDENGTSGGICGSSEPGEEGVGRTWPDSFR